MFAYFYLFIAGLVGGFIAGFLGVGGGIIYILILPTALTTLIGVNHSELATYTVANSIFGIVFTSLSGVFTHLSLKTFYLKETLIIGLSSALASGLIIAFIVNLPGFSPKVYNFILVVLIGLAIISFYLEKRKLLNAPRENENPVKMGMSGLISGAISGLTGLGGGIALIPILKYWVGINIKKAKSISLGMILISSTAVSFINLFHKPNHDYAHSFGLIIFTVDAALIFGVVLGSPFGVSVSHRMDTNKIQTAFMLFMLIVFFGKLIRLLSFY